MKKISNEERADLHEISVLLANFVFNCAISDRPLNALLYRSRVCAERSIAERHAGSRLITASYGGTSIWKFGEEEC